MCPGVSARCATQCGCRACSWFVVVINEMMLVRTYTPERLNTLYWDQQTITRTHKRTKTQLSNAIECELPGVHTTTMEQLAATKYASNMFLQIIYTIHSTANAQYYLRMRCMREGEGQRSPRPACPSGGSPGPSAALLGAALYFCRVY